MEAEVRDSSFASGDGVTTLLCTLLEIYLFGSVCTKVNEIMTRVPI